MSVFDKYHFNPFQFTGPDWWMRDFHRRHVAYFRGCRRVLDLGAGRGFFLDELKAVGIPGLGVENHAPSAAIGRASGHAYHETGIFEFFESEEGRAAARECDGVYCAHVIEHLDPEEVFRLFRAVKTHAAPGARCRFITNNPLDLNVLGQVFWGDLTHKRLYPADLLAAMARSQGFDTTRTELFLGCRIGKRAQIRRFLEGWFWGPHKWHPNLLLDCA